MLIEEYRGDIVENIHNGRICVVNSSGEIVCETGGSDTLTYYRSSAKPFQLIPLIQRGLLKKYALTDTEITVCAASHIGEEIHIEALESIMKKADLKESDLIMLPTYPIDTQSRQKLLKSGMPARKIFHNCSGKHLALMILARELCGDETDYWKMESKAQIEVLRAVANISDYPMDKVKIGIDGCGVPVFGVPLKSIALAYMRLANPNTVSDQDTKIALTKIADCIAKNPYMIRGHQHICGELNARPNLVAKCGAEGVYGIGLKREGLGIAIKMADGTEHTMPIVVAEVLRQLNYNDEKTFEALKSLKDPIKYNDNDFAIGEYRPAFKLQKK